MFLARTFLACTPTLARFSHLVFTMHFLISCTYLLCASCTLFPGQLLLFLTLFLLGLHSHGSGRIQFGTEYFTLHSSPFAYPFPGFYLGYLRGRSFPPKCLSSPPPKILLSLQHISNYIGKIIQTRRGQCTHCNISQNCLKMHQIASQRIFISKMSRKVPHSPRKLVTFRHWGLLPQTINLRQNFDFPMRFSPHCRQQNSV